MRKSIRNQEWKKALSYYKQSKGEERRYENPLVFNTKESCGITWADKQPVSRIYSTKQVLELAIELEKKAKRKKPTDLYNYGMLLYHLSYYGKLENLAVWDHRNYGVPAYTSTTDSISYESDYYNIPWRAGMNSTEELDNYFNLTSAKGYFDKAYSKLKSPEEKAQCAFMQALCWQKNGDQILGKHKKDYGNKWYYNASVQNPYFKTLKNDFGNTKTYQRAFSTCSYLRMYVGR